MNALSIGMIGTATMVVGTNDTAPKVGSGHIDVLATPVMINLAEEAALNAVESHLSGRQAVTWNARQYLAYCCDANWDDGHSKSDSDQIGRAHIGLCYTCVRHA